MQRCSISTTSRMAGGRAGKGGGGGVTKGRRSSGGDSDPRGPSGQSNGAALLLAAVAVCCYIDLEHPAQATAQEVECHTQGVVKRLLREIFAELTSMRQRLQDLAPQ